MSRPDSIQRWMRRMAVVSCGFMAAEILLVLLLFTVLIALLVRYSVRLSRSVAQPVVDLSRRAEDVIGGDLTVREPVRSETYEIRTLSEGMEQMIARLNAQIQETTQKQASLRKAELALLQAQINPHFLYNTMDTIIWLIEANRPQAAVEMVSDLSNFFRHSRQRCLGRISSPWGRRRSMSAAIFKSSRPATRTSWTTPSGWTPPCGRRACPS